MASVNACPYPVEPWKFTAATTYPRALRSAVNEVDQRVLFRRVEPRRLENPAEHRIAQRAHEAERLERPEVELRQRGVVRVGERLAVHPHLGRRGRGLMQPRECLAIGRDGEAGVDPRA